MIGQGFFGFMLPKFKGPATAQELNNMQYFEVFNRITNIALSRFTWKNLPASCRPEILEMTLYFYGCALFFFDPEIGYAHTPVNLPGPFNLYYESIRRMAYSFRYRHEYTDDNSVLIKANHTMLPDYMITWNYTPKIANCLRAIDVHTETLKSPFLITCPDKALQSVKQALKRIAENEVAIVGEKIGDNGVIDIKPLVTSSNLTDMWANVKNYLNQVFSALGVKNSYTEKRERMITPEAEGEQNAVRHTLESELEERKLACERINKMFGLNVDVEANQLEVFTDEFIELAAAKVTGARRVEEEQESEVEE